MIELTLPYPISANRYWASRVIKSKTTGKWMSMTYVTPEAQAYKNQVAGIVRAAQLQAPITGRVFVDLTLYPSRPQDWERRARKDPLWADTVQRLDIDNARKVVYDALKGIAFEDDKRIWDDAGHVREPDAHGPRVVVRISPIAVDMPQASLLEPA